MESVPESGRTEPLMMESSVDFPAPFSPTRPSTECRFRLKLTSSSAMTPG
jgi:hypothetical protein